MKTLRQRLSSPVIRRVGKVAVVAGLLLVLLIKLKLSPVGVVGHAVEARPVVAEVMGTGTLEARITTTVSPRIQEQLLEVLVDQGDVVREGQLLVRLDDSELRQQVAVAEAALEAAQATANRVRIDEARAAAVEEQARQDYQRESDLLTGGVSSQAERDKALERLRIAESDLKTAHAMTTEAVLRVVTAEKSLLFEKERLAYTEITSPYAGLVIRRDRDPGEVVVPGSSILQLISTNELWLSAWVDETAMADLATGQTARVVFRSEPTRSHPGVVTRLGRQTDRETREFLVDVRVERLPLNWAVGQRGEVYIETAREDAALGIPEIFIHWRNGKPGVFVDREGKARWQGVVLGLQGAGFVQVLQGLQEGDWVVMPAPGRRGTLVDGQRIRRT
jgi:HlyD family secretion protein